MHTGRLEKCPRCTDFVPRCTDSTQTSNYRPISLTSICCKLLEHILYLHIMAYFNKNNLLFENQHGFRSEQSCQTQLFELVNDLHRSLHSSLYVDALFIDYSIAFDHVFHKRLLLKVSTLQLDSRTTEWIKEFLTNRFQSVKFNNLVSNCMPVKFGVPQAL